MSTSYSLSIQDRATPALRAKIAKCSAQRLNAFIGPAESLLVKHNFLKLPTNKMGWKSTGFWSGAARSTNWQTVVTGVMVTVNWIGARLRYQGGTIRPVNAKALTLPVAEEAYGKTAADFGDRLQLIVIKGKGAWLALKSFVTHGGDKKVGGKRVQDPARSTLRDRLKFLFRLVSGVEQAANPDVLPTDEEILNTAVTAAEAAIK